MPTKSRQARPPFGQDVPVGRGNKVLAYFHHLYCLFQVCRSGQIQLNYQFSLRWPQKFGVYKMPLIAPFWAVTDQYFAFKANVSTVYYHVYEQSRQSTVQTRGILDMASQHVREYDSSATFASFSATWVLVVTWVDLCPYVIYPESYYSSQKIPSLNCPWVSI